MTCSHFFFFNDTATTEIYTLSLHDALPIYGLDPVGIENLLQTLVAQSADGVTVFFSSHQIAEVERVADHVCILEKDRKSTRLNSSHGYISYAVFCLKKKTDI